MAIDFDPKAARNTLMAYHDFVSDLERLRSLRRVSGWDYKSKAEEITGRLRVLRGDTSQIENLAYFMKEYRLDFERAEIILNSIKDSSFSSTKMSEFSESIPTLQELASFSAVSA